MYTKTITIPEEQPKPRKQRQPLVAWVAREPQPRFAEGATPEVSVVSRVVHAVTVRPARRVLLSELPPARL
jgi:hypothetical protein